MELAGLTQGLAIVVDTALAQIRAGRPISEDVIFSLDMKSIWAGLMSLRPMDEFIALFTLRSFLALLINNDDAHLLQATRDCDPVKSQLAAFRDPSFSFDERASLSFPLTVFMFALGPDVLTGFCFATIEYIEAYTAATGNFPKRFLTEYCDRLPGAFLDADIRVIVSLLPKFMSKHTIGTTLLLSCFASHVAGSELITWPLLNALLARLVADRDPFVKSAAYVLIAHSHPFWESPRVELPPDSLYEYIRVGLSNHNRFVVNYAYRALRYVLKSWSFRTQSNFARFLAGFQQNPAAPEKLCLRIFKEFLPARTSFHIYDDDRQLAARIAEWAASSFRNPHSQFILVGITGILALTLPELCRDLYPLALADSAALIAARRFDTFEDIANLMCGIVQNFSDDVHAIAQIEDHLPALVACLDFDFSARRKIAPAVAIASILATGTSIDLVPSLIRFVIASDAVYDDSLFGRLEKVLSLLKAHLGPWSDDLATVYMRRARSTLSVDFADGCFRLLGKLLKRYSLDADVVALFACDIVSGNLAIYNGIPLAWHEDPSMTSFRFVSRFIRTLPSRGRPICENLVAILPEVRVPTLAALIAPIRAGLAVGVFSDEMASTLGQGLRFWVARLDCGDVGEFIAVVKALGQLFRAFPAALGGLPFYVDVLSPIVAAVTDHRYVEDDENDGDDRSIDDLMQPIANFAFALYASGFAIEVDVAFIAALVRETRVMGHGRAFEASLRDLMAIMEDQERFGQLTMPILSAFVQILGLDGPAFLPADLVDEMSEVIARVVAANRELEGELVETFRRAQSSMAALARMLRPPLANDPA
jgi:hypothetical protein